MFNISDNGIITLNKGDTVEFAMFINQGTKLFPERFIDWDANTALYFGVFAPNQKTYFKTLYPEDQNNLEETNDITCGCENNIYFYAQNSTSLDMIKPLPKCCHGPKEPLIEKIITSANLNEDLDPVITINYDDTKDLEPGLYYYEVKLKYVDENNNIVINTPVSRTKFVLFE